MQSFDEVRLAEILGKLTRARCVGFGAACAERLITSYQAFAMLEQWGDYASLRKILDTIWQFVANEDYLMDHIDDMIGVAEACIPDTGKAWRSCWLWPAHYGSIAVSDTLRSCQDGDASRIARVGQLTVNAVDSYLFTVNAPNPASSIIDEDVLSSVESMPLMLAETRQQVIDLGILADISRSMDDVVRSLRSASQAIGIHPIARRLITGP